MGWRVHRRHGDSSGHLFVVPTAGLLDQASRIQNTRGCAAFLVRALHDRMIAVHCWAPTGTALSSVPRHVNGRRDGSSRIGTCMEPVGGSPVGDSLEGTVDGYKGVIPPDSRQSRTAQGKTKTTQRAVNSVVSRHL